MNKFLGILAASWLTGCASAERDYFETGEILEKAMPVLQYEQPEFSGSIYRDQPRSTKFGFRKNFGVGDILTVVLNESTQAQRSNGINTTKEVSNSPLSQLKAAFGNNLPVAADNNFTDSEIRIKRGLKALTFCYYTACIFTTLPTPRAQRSPRVPRASRLFWGVRKKTRLPPRGAAWLAQQPMQAAKWS